MPAPPDFVARLGSRASVPEEVRSSWGVAEYVEGLDRLDHPSELGDPSATETPRVVELVETLATADVGRLDRDRLRVVLTALARPPMAELNLTALGAATGVPATTLPPYVDALERLGLIRLLPGARSPVAKRAIARPRVVIEDAALARELSGTPATELLRMGGRARLAPLLEGMAAAELLRQQATSRVGFRLAHLRERNGLAVDLLVELPDDTVYGIEVRTAAGFRPHQFAALETLATRAGPRFRGGVVLNTAPVGLEYRPGLWTLPLSSLWDWD